MQQKFKQHTQKEANNNKNNNENSKTHQLTTFLSCVPAKAKGRCTQHNAEALNTGIK